MNNKPRANKNFNLLRPSLWRYVFYYIPIFLISINVIKAQAPTIPIVIEPPCDYLTSDLVSLSSSPSGLEGVNVAYYLTDDNGVILQGPVTTPNFGILPANGYLVYAVTSDGILSAETNIQDLTNSGGCVAFSEPVEIVVCYSEEITTSDPISIIGIGGNTTGGSCITVLTDNAGLILATDNGTSANFPPQVEGEYFIYVYCSDNGLLPATGQNINAVSCSGCCDWSGPYSVLVRNNEEICDNGIDDDGDGAIDCADENCNCPCTSNIEGIISDMTYHDNNTPSNLGDDTFTFNLLANNDSSNSGWTGGGKSGNYGELVSFGPYPVDQNGVGFQVKDNANQSCFFSVSANMNSCTYNDTCTCCATNSN